MSEREPSITVVVPVWDSPYAELLPAAVASVRRQDTRIPIVIVDNASGIRISPPAGTTLVPSERRLTTGAARNLGLQSVDTECVIFLDADDEICDGALEILSEGIQRDPRLVAYVMSIVEADTGKRHRTPRALAFRLSRFPRLFAFVTTLWSLYPTQSGTIMRTASVRAAGGYGDADRGEDWVLSVALAFRGRVRLDKRPGRIYRVSARAPQGEVIPMDDVRSVHRQIRERLADDPSVPRGLRVLMPVIAGLQLIGRLSASLYRGGRRLLTRAAE